MAEQGIKAPCSVTGLNLACFTWKLIQMSFSNYFGKLWDAPPGKQHRDQVCMGQYYCIFSFSHDSQNRQALNQALHSSARCCSWYQCDCHCALTIAILSYDTWDVPDLHSKGKGEKDNSIGPGFCSFCLLEHPFNHSRVYTAGLGESH